MGENRAFRWDAKKIANEALFGWLTFTISVVIFATVSTFLIVNRFSEEESILMPLLVAALFLVVVHGLRYFLAQITSPMKKIVGEIPLKRVESLIGGLEMLPAFPAPKLCRIPIVGEIAAGRPLLVEENIEGYIMIEEGRAQNVDFALRVKGDSMVGAGIANGDRVFIRSQSFAENGDIVVVMMDRMGVQETTLKRYYYDGLRIHLWSETLGGQREEFLSVDKKDAPKMIRILGKVVAV